ncbi:MAG: hypothetical protein F9K44_01910 [Hyphomicrobiaceae bacterium]|nr:MAG: hypothetical protein F9K44_01910 [Hyphomicrobiaceae bacterium]
MASTQPNRRGRPDLKIVSSRSEPGPPPRRQPMPPPGLPSDPFAVDMKRDERAANEAELSRDEDRRRLRANVLAALWVILIVSGAVWLIESARDNARVQECFARGYKNCVKTELPR